MVYDRGYNIPDDEIWLLKISSEESENELRENIEYFYEKYFNDAMEKDSRVKKIKPKNYIRSLLSKLYKNNDGDQIYVYFAEVPDNVKQLGNDIIQLFSQYITKYNLQRAIIISELNVSASSQNTIRGLGKNIQVFIDDKIVNELIYNPVRHKSVVPHRLLSKEEEQRILEEFGVRKNNLQSIKSSDPIAKYYDFPDGSIIELKRYDRQLLLNQNTLNYRVVIRSDKIDS